MRTPPSPPNGFTAVFGKLVPPTPEAEGNQPPVPMLNAPILDASAPPPSLPIPGAPAAGAPSPLNADSDALIQLDPTKSLIGKPLPTPAQKRPTGDFTKLFRKLEIPNTPPKSEPAIPSVSPAMPPSLATPPSGPSSPPAPTLPAPQLPAAAPPSAAPAAAPPPTPAASEAPSKKSYVPLIIALNVILLGAIAVILFVVLRHKG